MKLLGIILYNLASFEGEHVIDLESEPLKSADLFSIVGETGSGKSTILDAVCLALYGVAPRFFSADNFDYYNVDKPDNDKILEPDDPRNILRKGARECRAEVLFLARDGFRYRAVWSCSFARVNYTRPFRRLYRLMRDEEGQVYEKEVDLNAVGRQRRGHKNVNNEVLNQIIGLDYNQFTRTVMLAQNSFANFVRADDKDKAVLLEKLTGSQFYTAIARKIYEFYKQAEDSYSRLYDEVKAYAVHRLEDKKLEDCLLRQKELDNRMEEGKQKLAGIEDGFRWFAEKERLRQMVIDETKNWETAVTMSETLEDMRKKLRQVEEVAEVRELYLKVTLLENKVRELNTELSLRIQEKAVQENLWKQSREQLEDCRRRWMEKKEAWSGLFPKLNEARRLQAEQKGMEEQLKRVDAELKLRSTRLSQLEKRKEENNRKLADWQKKGKEACRWLQEWETHRELLENVGTVTERLSQWSQMVQNNLSGLAAWKEEEQVLAETKKELETAAGGLKDWEKQQKTLWKEIQERQSETSQTKSEDLQKQLDEVTARFKIWDGASQTLRSIMQLNLDKEKVNKEMADGEKFVLDLEKEVALIQQEQNAVNLLIPGLEEAYRMMSGQTAVDLRERLKPGEPCPVCGALQHPYAKEEGWVIQPVKDKLDNMRRRLEELTDLLEKLPGGLRWKLASGKGEQAARTAHLKQLEVRIHELKDGWKDFLLQCPELAEIVQAYESKGDLSGLQGYLQVETSRLVERGRYLREKQNKQIAGQKELEALRMRYDRQTETWHKLQEAWHRDMLAYRQREGMQKQKHHELEQGRGQAEELHRQLKGLVTLSGWEEIYGSDISVLIRELNVLSATYRNSLAMTQKADVIVEECAGLEKAIEQQIGEEQKAYQNWMEDKDKVAARSGELKRMRIGLIGEALPDELELEWTASLGALERQCVEAEQQFVRVSEKLNHMEGMRASVEMQYKEQLSACAVRQHELESYIQQYNNRETADSGWRELLTRDLLEAYFSSDAYWVSCREQIRKADEEVKLCLGRKEVSERNMELHRNQGVEKGFLLEGKNDSDSLALLKIQKEETVRNIGQVDQERQSVGGILSAHYTSLAQMESCQEELDCRLHLYHNWKELNEILGNANGDKFREVAQCFTLRFLVRQANEQLRMLNHRYSLEQVPDTLGIRVIDHDHANEVRNISSLSGGETFLVSLALALGLSSLSSRYVPVSNLFVDEGFGTLDAASLNLVIDALSNLQSMQGKKVGVISHTAEMKERIRTQIQVIKAGSGGKSFLKIE